MQLMHNAKSKNSLILFMFVSFRVDYTPFINYMKAPTIRRGFRPSSLRADQLAQFAELCQRHIGAHTVDAVTGQHDVVRSVAFSVTDTVDCAQGRNNSTVHQTALKGHLLTSVSAFAALTVEQTHQNVNCQRVIVRPAFFLFTVTGHFQCLSHEFFEGGASGFCHFVNLCSLLSMGSIIHIKTPENRRAQKFLKIISPLVTIS